jgi:hypothetical protein
MAYSKYTTLVCGYTADPALAPKHPNRATCISDADYAEQARAAQAWSDAHYKSTRRAGRCSAETCKKMAAKIGITHGAKAEAASFDSSGKGRHSFVKIAF